MPNCIAGKVGRVTITYACLLPNRGHFHAISHLTPPIFENLCRQQRWLFLHGVRSLGSAGRGWPQRQGPFRGHRHWRKGFRRYRSGGGALGTVVALCDIDERHLNSKSQKFPDAKKFFDFRQMLDDMGKQIDAVTVSTPDHTHAPASVMAMKMKKHVYTQKPLTHTVHEARVMRETAAKMGVATQMGNQGSAANGLRRAVEAVQAGIIGPVSEAHVWTNRPIWPQAPKIMTRPPESPTPSYVHWDEFIGPAPMRPYADYEEKRKDRRTGEEKITRKGYYHDFAWRGWWDFGTGALGDMACHTANMAFRAKARLSDERGRRRDRCELGNLPVIGSGHIPVSCSWGDGTREIRLVRRHEKWPTRAPRREVGQRSKQASRE